MTRSIGLLVVAFWVAFSGCVTASLERSFDLKTVRSLVPGATTTDEILKQLGSSQLVVPEAGAENWLYFEGHGNRNQRLALNIDSRSKVLRGVTWLVADGDSEKSLSEAMKLFPEATFKKRPDRWVGHASAGEQVYSDLERGIEIVLWSARQEVSAISWGVTAQARGVATRRSE